MSIHEVWLIVTENGQACFDQNGQIYCYRTEMEAVLSMAKLIKNNPERKFSLKKTKIQLPWL